MAMQTRVDRVDAGVPVTVMALDGELDASNYLRLVDDVRELYASGTRNLLLDLADLSFIASSGLVALYPSSR
jgi:anti-anti-sigma factor